MDYQYRVPPSFVCWFLTPINHSYTVSTINHTIQPLISQLGSLSEGGPILYPINLCVFSFTRNPRVTGFLRRLDHERPRTSPCRAGSESSRLVAPVIWCRWSLGFTSKTQRNIKKMHPVDCGYSESIRRTPLNIWQPTKTVVISGNQTGLTGKIPYKMEVCSWRNRFE